MSTPSSENERTGFEFPAEYAVHVTDIIRFWAALEHNVDMSIWHLAGVYPAIGVCITSQIFTLDGRLKALRALLSLRRAPTDLTKLANVFAENVRGPLEIRNRIVHDPWLQGYESKKMVQLEIGAKGVLTYGFKDIPIETLKNDRERVRKAMVQSVNLRDTVEAALPTLPDIPLKALHPIVLDRRGHEQTQSSDKTFVLFPPKPSPG